jgi:peptidoglycan/LPS O-acetylase OafA/YrhL
MPLAETPEQAAVHTQAVPPAAKAFFRPELDALRFFCFLGVFVYHTLGHAPWEPVRVAANAGAFGVDVFLAISAYLITELLRREGERFGTINVRYFYLRRSLRIWPLYLASVAAIFLIQAWIPGERIALGQAGLFALFCGNWLPLFQFMPQSSMIYPLWSVSLEEQFYLAWPSLVRRMTVRRVATASLVMLGTSAAARVAAEWAGVSPGAIWTNTLTHLDSLALGAGLSVWLNGRMPAFSCGRRVALACAGVGGLLVVAGVTRIPYGGLAGNSVGFLLLAASAIAIVIATLGVDARPASVFVRLGQVSYDLYVLHEPVLMVIRQTAINTGLEPWRRTAAGFGVYWIVSLLAVVGLALASYRYFERPFLRLKERFALITSRPVES